MLEQTEGQPLIVQPLEDLEVRWTDWGFPGWDARWLSRVSELLSRVSPVRVTTPALTATSTAS